MGSLDDSAFGTLDDTFLDFDVEATDLGDGSATSPSLAFQNDDDLGLYRIGANTLGLAANGARHASLDTSELLLEQDLSFKSGTANKVTLDHAATAARTLTLPDATDTLVGLATTDTLTNKTLTSAVLGTDATLDQTTANYTLTWADPASARTINIPDPGGNDDFLFAAATQTLTNKTIDAAQNTLSGVVSATGSPADNQVAIFTDADTLEGTTSLEFDGTNFFHPVPTALPADGDLSNGQIAFAVDETNDELEIKVKKSGGAVVTGTVALA